MTIFIFSLLLFGVSLIAGLLGALTGLGGGVILIPALVLLFHINIHYAMGASLISVITTSSGTAAAFLREGYTNLRIGMFLEIGSVIGALVGAILVAWIPSFIIAILFSMSLFASAYFTLRRQKEPNIKKTSHPWAIRLRLNGKYPEAGGLESYSVQSAPLALGIMTIAGGLSGLLGIGAGALKVVAMDQIMRLPYKVSTTTSNFIIGITAAVSAGVYLANGYIDPGITFPVMLGVALGSIVGAKLLIKASDQRLRWIFSLAICLLGLQMLYKGLTGAL